MTRTRKHRKRAAKRASRKQRRRAFSLGWIPYIKRGDWIIPSLRFDRTSKRYVDSLQSYRDGEVVRVFGQTGLAVVDGCQFAADAVVRVLWPDGRKASHPYQYLTPAMVVVDGDE